MTYQWYWPSWWRLWPHYSYLYCAYYEPDDHPGNFKYTLNFFCFGPFQCHWNGGVDK